MSQATTSIEDLSKLFKAVLLKNPDGRQSSIEGLAYSSLQPAVKEDLAKDKQFLENLVKALKEAPPKWFSPEPIKLRFHAPVGGFVTMTVTISNAM